MRKIKLLSVFLFFSLFVSQSNYANRMLCYQDGGKWHCLVTSGSCFEEGCKKYWDGWDCCKNLAMVRFPKPIIRVQKNGSAFLINGKQIIQLGSDKLEAFITKSRKPTKKLFSAFFKTDDGVVSAKRLAVFVKEFNATIVKSSKPIKANYCPACEDEKVKAAQKKTAKV